MKRFTFYLSIGVTSAMLGIAFLFDTDQGEHLSSSQVLGAVFILVAIITITTAILAYGDMVDDLEKREKNVN